jgi:hypothetical protein
VALKESTHGNKLLVALASHQIGRPTLAGSPLANLDVGQGIGSGSRFSPQSGTHRSCAALRRLGKALILLGAKIVKE